MTTHSSCRNVRPLVVAALVGLAGIGPTDVNAQDNDLDALSRRVDSVFADFDRADSPGCALGIIRDGRYILARGYGMANLDDAIPLTASTTIYVASVAKQFVAASVLLAVEQGHFSLDDDVRQYVPELSGASGSMKIRHLIHHTSGLRDTYGLAWLQNMQWTDSARARVANAEGILKLLSAQDALNFAPGRNWAYTTSNYQVLAIIMERAVGKPLWEFAESELFGPLGMTNTGIHQGEHLGASGYSKSDGKGIEAASPEGRWGAYTSLEDFLIWDRHSYADASEKYRFLSQLDAPGILDNGQEVPYGFGLNLTEHRGVRTVSHDGSFWGFRAAMLRFPDQRVSVVCFCNHDSVRPLARAGTVVDLVMAHSYRDSDEPPSNSLQLSDSEKIDKTGTYMNSLGRVITLDLVDGRLAFVGSRGTNELSVIGEDRFRSLHPAFSRNEYLFERDGPDAPWYFDVLVGIPGWVPPPLAMRFRQIELTSPSAEALAEYVGEYYSRETQAIYRIRQVDGSLEVGPNGGSATQLQPTVKDQFRVGSWGGQVLDFVRNEEGEITGFDYRSGGVWNLRFGRFEVVDQEG